MLPCTVLLWVLGILLQVSTPVQQALSHWAISPAPTHSFLTILLNSRLSFNAHIHNTTHTPGFCSLLWDGKHMCPIVSCDCQRTQHRAPVNLQALPLAPSQTPCGCRLVTSGGEIVMVHAFLWLPPSLIPQVFGPYPHDQACQNVLASVSESSSVSQIL